MVCILSQRRSLLRASHFQLPATVCTQTVDYETELLAFMQVFKEFRCIVHERCICLSSDATTVTCAFLRFKPSSTNVGHRCMEIL